MFFNDKCRDRLFDLETKLCDARTDIRIQRNTIVSMVGKFKQLDEKVMLLATHLGKDFDTEPARPERLTLIDKE